MTTAGSSSAQPLAQPIRALLGAVSVVGKLKLGPPLESLLGKPHAERLGHLNPGFMTRKVTALIDTEDVQVPGRGGPIPARVYRRPNTPPGAPGYLFIHGGGFAFGGVAFCDHVCRELAERSGFVVVGLSYRLAPDHPFPAGVEDCQDVLTWMAQEAPGGLDPDRLAVAGESAGGNLTALLAVWSRDGSGPRLAHHAPVYPLTDFTGGLIDWSEAGSGNPGVTPQVHAAMGDAYCGDTRPEDPLMSPLFADHRELPPALVVTCGHDVLRPEGVALVDSYREAGVDVTHVHLADMPHGHLLMTRLTKRSYETMELMIAQAKRYV